MQKATYTQVNADDMAIRLAALESCRLELGRLSEATQKGRACASSCSQRMHAEKVNKSKGRGGRKVSV